MGVSQVGALTGEFSMAEMGEMMAVSKFGH